ncbi:DNA-directed RNA polymerase subunit H [Faustovirus]|nr:DNA-directed RNA polymerase subunit H [Faustovirus]QJX72220.1 DNA-directed RNA polymerase subunit H [Faustovirus]QJX72715.1 DNA-directed RNA polymerase subunit H [Faustovirus]QJX73212.1 DNA-directed RNA polymerase subunit H [Faustovirus]QJX73719.1 DNA-directed RNA polymerase subunit H [Faustovirus]
MSVVTDKFEPFEVYKHVHEMLPYRGMAPELAMMNETQVKTAVNQEGYVLVPAMPAPGTIRELNDGAKIPVKPVTNGKFIVVIFNINSRYLDKSASIDNLMKNILKQKPIQLLFVLPHIEVKKSILAKLDNFSKTGEIYVEVQMYPRFIIHIPKHRMSQPHIIADKAEVDEYCMRYKTAPKNFPKIKVGDAQAVWIGAKKGDVVKVFRISETSGKHNAYRICED